MTTCEKSTIYDTVLRMAWGDRRLAVAERAIADAVAGELGMPQRQAPPGALDPEALRALSPVGRRVSYALAAWMAYGDGVEHPAERAMLHRLRDELDLSGDTAFVLESIALIVCGLARSKTPREQCRMLCEAVVGTSGSLA